MRPEERDAVINLSEFIYQSIKLGYYTKILWQMDMRNEEFAKALEELGMFVTNPELEEMIVVNKQSEVN